MRELQHTSELCRSCYVLAHKKDVKCVVCGNIRKLQGRGMCSRCYLSRPEYKEKRNKARRDRYQNDPAYREQTQALRIRSANRPSSVDHTAAYSRWRTYGLTTERFSELLATQQGSCAICKTVFCRSSKNTTEHVDHCHVTGQVRGLLCGTCNLGLGSFKDSQTMLSAAVEYLKTTGGN